MRKFLFFLFFVCVSAPSFANQCGNHSVVISDGQKLLYYEVGINTVQDYITCDNSQPTNNELMVGCDGRIYKCNNKKWEQLNNINQCPSGWNAASQRNRPENTISNPTEIGEIYFLTLRDNIYVLENSICKYTKTQCDKDHDSCIESGRVPIQRCRICNNIAGSNKTVENIHFIVKDKDTREHLEDVKFLYDGFLTDEYKERSIAKYDRSTKYYTITWHPSNTGDIKVLKDGYDQKKLLIKDIPLHSGGTYFIELEQTKSSSSSTKQPTITPINNLTPVPATELPTCSNEIERIDITLPEVTDTNTDTGNYAENFVCVYTGGNYKDADKTCTCDPDEHLENDILNIDGKEFKVCRCVAGYHRDGAPVCTNQDGIPVYAAHGTCVPANDYEEGKELDKTAMRLDAENAYRKDYDRSQSIANKALTAVSTGMTGEGAMKAAQALAEQKADERAEREIAEYITTMQCEYGNGQQVALGKEETLPAGDLSKYYTEYKQLADKLKETKTALNLRPGIETEVLYDRAETGLYQYQTAERQSGGFTSVARALMDPTGADAAAWTTQKALVAENLKKGTLETIGGAALGLAGNYVINGERDPEYKKLKEKFRTIKIELHNKYPEIFTLDTEEESRDEITTISLPPIQTNDTSVSVPTSINMEEYTVSAEAFQSGRISLSSDGTSALITFATEISALLRDNPSTTIKITATGYTDPQKIKQESATINWLTNTEYNKNNFGYNPTPKEKYPTGKIKENKDLATARAERVTTFLNEYIDTNLKQRIRYDFDGKDEKECKETQKENYVKCRKVVVTITDTTSNTSQ